MPPHYKNRLQPMETVGLPPREVKDNAGALASDKHETSGSGVYCYAAAIICGPITVSASQGQILLNNSIPRSTISG